MSGVIFASAISIGLSVGMMVGTQEWSDNISTQQAALGHHFVTSQPIMEEIYAAGQAISIVNLCNDVEQEELVCPEDFTFASLGDSTLIADVTLAFVSSAQAKRIVEHIVAKFNPVQTVSWGSQWSSAATAGDKALVFLGIAKTGVLSALAVAQTVYGVWQLSKIASDMQHFHPHAESVRFREAANSLEADMQLVIDVLTTLLGEEFVPTTAFLEPHVAYAEEVAFWEAIESSAACDCERRTVYLWDDISEGCIVTQAAPSNYACQCTLSGNTCSGRVVLCMDPSTDVCKSSDATSIRACIQGNGDCAGYSDLYHEQCQCSLNVNANGCRIKETTVAINYHAYPNTACKCMMDFNGNSLDSCEGRIVPCANPYDPKCIEPDDSLESCIQAGSSSSCGGYDDHCECAFYTDSNNNHAGGCKITSPAPAGFACQCMEKANVCYASVVACQDPNSDACLSSTDTSISACFDAPGSQCGGYGCKCQYVFGAGCKVTEAAPAGSACYCKETTCTAYTVACAQPEAPACLQNISHHASFTGTSLAACLQGSEHCGGYPNDLTCQCEAANGGCKISGAAPPGYACKCRDDGLVCNGKLALCQDHTNPLCDNPDTSIDSCLLGGGNCKGYNQACECKRILDSCYISQAPPPGYACYCYKGTGDCDGYLSLCMDPEDAGCTQPDFDLVHTCTFGGGNCHYALPAPHGTECTEDNMCAGGECVRWGSNAANTKCCTNSLVKTMGDTKKYCVNQNDPGDACKYDDQCDFGSCVENLCVENGDANDPCEYDGHVSCKYPLHCAIIKKKSMGEKMCCESRYKPGGGSWYCDINMVDGVKCDYNSQCSSNVCRSHDNTCYSPLGHGNACNHDDECSGSNKCKWWNRQNGVKKCCNNPSGSYCTANLNSYTDGVNAPSCDKDDQCHYGVCKNNKCWLLPNRGMPCKSNLGWTCRYPYKCGIKNRDYDNRVCWDATFLGLDTKKYAENYLSSYGASCRYNNQCKDRDCKSKECK